MNEKDKEDDRESLNDEKVELDENIGDVIIFKSKSLTFRNCLHMFTFFKEEEDSDDADLGKYDLAADPEFFAFKVEPLKLKSSTINDDDRSESAMSSE